MDTREATVVAPRIWAVTITEDVRTMREGRVVGAEEDKHQEAAVVVLAAGGNPMAEA
jgi:hypothetical protein